jgi:hypothetical protein
MSINLKNASRGAFIYRSFLSKRAKKVTVTGHLSSIGILKKNKPRSVLKTQDRDCAPQ